MSRVGNRLINIPDGVSLENKDSHLMVKGPNGNLSVNLCEEISIDIKDSVMNITRKTDDKTAKSMHGTTRQLISNAIEGVTNGFSKHLEIIGVGFNVNSQNNRLIFQLGFSHDIAFDLPEGIEAIAQKTSLEIKGSDKQLVGQVAAKIRSLKKPEPYKGKGIRYKDEYVRSKQGKTVGGGD
jgi:large subunit ribosomal protein L6|tara:strand:- start:1947 stop:2489 length:543 start_codon:yes stop_codon:yes gene_type:complete